MMGLARTDTSIVGRWWWTVDRWTLLAVTLLVGVGFVLTLAAGPAAAERIGLDSFHFPRRQLLFLFPALGVTFAISLMSPVGVRRLAAIGFCLAIILMVVTLLFGLEIKGARRWLTLGGASLQPSEFVKPFFVVVSAWLFAAQKQTDAVPGNVLACLLFALVLGLLLAQPDYGMSVVVAFIWGAQFFLAGLQIAWVGVLTALALAGAVAAYLFVPHVASRVDRFFDPASGDSYQVDTALNAFSKGGLFGTGPGEGEVKRMLPDAHTDFIFAVAGEEFGLLICLLILALFAFITLRGFNRLNIQADLFALLAAAGLIMQFGLQAVVNISVNLNLMPTKGMTLPFISYGGSSMLALAISMGMVLALTRQRPGGSRGA